MIEIELGITIENHHNATDFFYNFFVVMLKKVIAR